MNSLLAETTSVSSRIEWRNLPESWQAFVFLFVVIGLLGYVVWSYLREVRQFPIWARFVLAGLRLAVILILIVLYLDPVKTDYRELQRRPTVAVLSDLSQSMEQVDGWREEARAQQAARVMQVDVETLQTATPPRLELLRRVLAGDEGLAARLRHQANVRVMTFGDSVGTVTTLPAEETESAAAPAEFNAASTNDAEATDAESDAEPISPEAELAAMVQSWSPDQRGSDLYQAIEQALGISQLQAIYLLSDGQHTTATEPVEIARRAREAGIPIYALGIGDPARPRNVSVKSVSVLDKARPNEPFSVDTILTAQEVTGSRLQVELLRQAIGPDDQPLGNEEVADSRELVVTDPAWLARERFTERLAEPGRYRYTIRVAAIDDELTDEDNRAQSKVMEVTDEKVKLLLIAGTASWEYQMLQKLYQRDQGIVLSCWLQSMAPERPQEGNARISVLPRTYEELAQYNVIFLVDPNPDEFDSAWMDALVKFVEQKAGGLFYLAGQRYATDFLTLERTAKIRDLLPVRLESGANAALSSLLQTSSGLADFQPVMANLDHQVLSFSPDRTTNLQIWERMPGIYWTYPAIAGKPTSKTLLVHSDSTLALGEEDRRPMLVAGRYGAGNTLYMGFTGSWRWRSVGVQAEYFDRFWIQAARYLVNTRSIQGLKRGTVDPDRETYELGDQVELTARLLDPRFEPLQFPEVTGQLTDAAGHGVPLTFRPIESQPGLYLATWRARSTGEFRVSVALPDVTDPDLIETAQFRVEAPSAEARTRWMNESLLREICETSGGQYFEVDQVAEAVAALPSVYETVQWREPPKPVWDLSDWTRQLLFFLPVVLLGIEWSLRKWLKLL